MKMKLIALVAGVMSLTGCASLNNAMIAHTNPNFIAKECVRENPMSEKSAIQCLLDKMDERDAARVQLGLPREAHLLREDLKRREQEEAQQAKIREAEERKQKEEDAKIEKIKKRDRCLIMSSAQLEDQLSNAIRTGDYARYEYLNSDEFRGKAIQYCNDLAK